jgi:hypothetical protein
VYPRDWQLFLKDGAGKEIAIAQLPAHLVSYIGASSEKVYLHHSYAKKAAEKHQLAPEHFPIIFDAVERGLVVEDRERHLTFFHLDPESKRWFQITIKKAADTARVYLCTFHRVTQRKVDNRLKTRVPIQK